MFLTEYRSNIAHVSFLIFTASALKCMQGFKHLDIISDRNLEMPKRSNSSCTECLKLMQSADRISHSQSMEIIPEEFVKNMQENCQLTALCQAIRGNELIFAMAFRDATPGNRTEACYAIGIC